MDSDNRICVAIMVIIAIIIIGLLLMIILLPLSFSYINYYEIAFARRKSTGKVDTSRVYTGGRYIIGPDHQFKEFTATAHFVRYSHIPIFTKDNLEVNITVELQYFLIKEDLKLLHDSYDRYYSDIIKNNAKDALKSSITKFDTDEFISNRFTIQNELFNAVRQRLSGKCCLPNCKKEKCDTCRKWEMCDTNCKPRETCTKDDKGIFVEVRYLQLHDIDIPNQVNERKLLSLIRDLEKEKEQSIKDETVVRKQTDLEVARIKNNASQLVAEANANAKYIVSDSRIKHERFIEQAHNDGIKQMIQELGLQSSKHKASLNYLRVLNHHEKVKYSIDFNTLITQSSPSLSS